MNQRIKSTLQPRKANLNGLHPPLCGLLQRSSLLSDCSLHWCFPRFSFSRHYHEMKATFQSCRIHNCNATIAIKHRLQLFIKVTIFHNLHYHARNQEHSQHKLPLHQKDYCVDSSPLFFNLNF
jgi:hypothetical protein